MKVAIQEGAVPAEPCSMAMSKVEAAQQELRPPFRVPASICGKLDIHMGWQKMTKRWNQNTANLAQPICSRSFPAI